MKKIIALILAGALPGSLSALDPDRVQAGGVAEPPSAAASAPAVLPEDRAEKLRLTVRQTSGWNTAEASDRTAGIKVGLKKIRAGEYDAEITAGNSRKFARISNYSGRYELSAWRTRLRMEERGDGYWIRGEAQIDSGDKPMRVVRLDLLRRPEPRSFHVHADGLRLTITDETFNGEADFEKYPKEVIGALTALLMTYFQETPRRNDRAADAVPESSREP